MFCMALALCSADDVGEGGVHLLQVAHLLRHLVSYLLLASHNLLGEVRSWNVRRSGLKGGCRNLSLQLSRLSFSFSSDADVWQHWGLLVSRLNLRAHVFVGLLLVLPYDIVQLWSKIS